MIAKNDKKTDWKTEIGLSVAVFCLALVPRALSLAVFATGDERDWVKNSIQFLAALLKRDWTGTYGLEHPGVTTMWAGTLGLVAHYWQEGGLSPEDLLSLLPTLPTNVVDIHLLCTMRVPIVLLTSASVTMIYLLLKGIIGRGAALLAAMLIAFDPVYLAHSRFLHLDGLLASFVTLSVLSAMLYLIWSRRAFHAILSALTAGLACLTKAPGVFLMPFMALASLIAFVEGRWGARAKRWPEAFRLVGFLLIWSALAVATYFLLWPAMWLDPLGTVKKAFGEVFNRAALSPHPTGRFFWGQAMLDPGPWFYPVAFLFRSTPLTLIGMLVAVGSLANDARLSLKQALSTRAKGRLVKRNEEESHLSQERVTLLLLLLCALSFTLFMSLGLKKSDRYLLPVFPLVDILAAVGLCRLGKEVGKRRIWLRGKEKHRFTLAGVGLISVLFLQMGFSLPQHPYYLTYYNPLFGGGWLAPQALSVGWGEGLDAAARYLNGQEGAAEWKVASWYSAQFAPFFVGETLDLSSLSPALRADRVVFYINQVQRGYPLPELVRYFQTRRPDYVVRLKGIDYAWVYTGPIYGFKPSPSIGHPTEELFSGKVKLLGYDLAGSRVESGHTLHVTLHWQCLGPMDEDYNVYLRLLDEGGHIWSRKDAYPLMGMRRTSDWEVGAFVMDEHDLEVPPGTPPGEYRLEVGLYSVETGRVLETSGEGECGPGGGLVLGAVSVIKPTAFPGAGDLDMQREMRVRWGKDIEFLGYDFTPGMVRPGDHLPLTLYWRARAEVKTDYLVSLWLEEEAGRVWGERRERPAGGRYPTMGWSKGEMVRDQRDFLVPPRILTGEYRLMVGLLDPEGDRLLGEAELGPVEAQGRARNFEVPPIENPLEVNLGGKIKLLGYEIASREIEPGGALHLTLYWQALREMDTSYTVFVHLLDAGNKIWGQRDSMPGNGALPTTGWVAGEVIVDEYEVVIQPEAPSGEYRIEVGLYEAATGRRLDVHDEQGEAQGDSLLLDSRLRVVR
ncbi:MAG: ArnT family glycosyltransferase [Anaerolineae bacterium]